MRREVEDVLPSVAAMTRGSVAARPSSSVTRARGIRPAMLAASARAPGSGGSADGAAIDARCRIGDEEHRTRRASARRMLGELQYGAGRRVMDGVVSRR